MKRPWFILAALLAWACAVLPVFADRDSERAHIKRALKAMGMTPADFRFAKDHGEPVTVLQGIRGMLEDPEQLFPLADETLEMLAFRPTGDTWRFASEKLEDPITPFQVLDKAPLEPLPGLDPVLGIALARFVQQAEKARGLLEPAYAPLNRRELQEAAAYHWCDVVNPSDYPERVGLFPEEGIPTSIVVRTAGLREEIDPEPAALLFLDRISRIPRHSVLYAGQVFQEAVYALEKELDGFAGWPETRPHRFYTEAGVIYIGTPGDDVYDSPALLILDPAGRDTYRGRAGAASFLTRQPLAAILDLQGDDLYEAAGLAAPGSACYGVSVLLDAGGDDVYRSAYTGTASAFSGAAWCEDRSGDDRYEGHVFGQGAAVNGFAILRDLEGRDHYDIGLLGQGFAGVLGVGILLDAAGSDSYFAGGRERDHERNDGRYLSLAQGMSIGLRPFAGGGYAVLADLEGNDTYRADVYGQGVGYWYAVGLLLDASGNDTYTMYQYGQGSGIHLSLGMLVDGEGDDLYTSFILAQGNAHDYAVGFMLELGGNDTYTADHHAQGRALNNGLALLLDAGGDDAYFARQNGQAQGIGNDAGKREYGSLALLLDLGGKDQYSCGAENNANLLRPDFGIVYDHEK